MDEGIIKRLAQGLPVFSVAGFAWAMTYAYGLFVPFGREWMSWLTLSDLIALTWTTIPMLLIGLIAGAAFQATAPERMTSTERDNSKPNKRPWFTLIIDIIAYFGILIPGILLASLSTQALEFGHWYLPILAIHIVSIFRLSGHFFSHSNAKFISFSVLAYTALVLGFLLGTARADSALNSNTVNIVRFKDGITTCQRLIFAGERGILLYNGPLKRTQFVSMDQVASVSKQERCWDSPPTVKAGGAG